ncbi:MAG: hypothetical protein JW706_04140 [Opitutales bacterium]|nr:hypothetical protein [Opitutales bacterium]
MPSKVSNAIVGAFPWKWVRVKPQQFLKAFSVIAVAGILRVPLHGLGWWES